jgi:hypothetical protein
MAYLAYGFLFENSGAGRLNEWAFGRPERPDLAPSTSTKHRQALLPSATRGYRAIEDEILPVHLRTRRKFENARSKFQSEVELAQARPDRLTSSGRRYQMVMQVARTAKAAGLEPAVLVIPTLRRVPHSEDLVRRLERATDGTLEIYNLNSPSRYPTFFATNNWWDWAHVNRLGAEEIARVLASEICDRRREN